MARPTGWRISAGIVICFVIGIAACGTGLYFIRASRAWHRNFERWQVEEPVRIRIDLASAGPYRAPFVQTCAIAHAQDVILVPVDPVDLARLRAAANRISVRITAPPDRDNQTVDMGAIETQSKSEFQLMRLAPVRDGRYEFAVEIEAGADQRPLAADLIVRNELCGLEAMPGLLYAVIGWPLVVIGVPFLFGAILRARMAPAQATPTVATTFASK